MQIYGKIHKEMREAMQYFASHLFTHQLSRHIDVRVTQKKDLGDIHGQVIMRHFNNEDEACMFINLVIELDADEHYDL